MDVGDCRSSSRLSPSASAAPSRRGRCCRALGPPAFSRWSPDAVGALERGLRAFAAAVGELAVLYLPSGELGVGPVPITAGEIAPHVRAIADGPTEECRLVTEDACSGLRPAYQANDHEHDEPFPYELAVWGAEWEAVARDTLPFTSAAPAA